MKKIGIIALLLVNIVSVAADTDLSLLYGTWVNPEYNTTRKPPKFVYLPNGTMEEYATTTASEPSYRFTYKVEESWQDAEGSHWYNVVATKIETQENRFWYLLIRINADGLTYEEDFIRSDLREFATEINPSSYFYKILYRE